MIKNQNPFTRLFSNETSELIKSHRSIRKYKAEPIPDEVLSDILAAAQWAPTSNNFQAYSIIVVKNTESRKKLSQLCKSQVWVETCPVFLVFCIDYHRLFLACEKNDTSFDISQLDHLLVGCVDTTLAVENAFLTARSHGLGGVMIGAVRKNIEQFSELLKLPRYVIPLVGIALGYPDEIPQQKPRFPLKGVAHEEYYHEDQVISAIEEYEHITEDYYTKRTDGERTEGWTKNIADYFASKKRPDIKDFVIKQGFNVK